MKYRLVTGEERERLLGTTKGTGVDYGPYLDIVTGLEDGEVVAIEIDPDHKRSEMLRFSRAIKTTGKTLNWLPNASPDEIVFQVSSDAPRRRGRPRKNPE